MTERQTDSNAMYQCRNLTCQMFPAGNTDVEKKTTNQEGEQKKLNSQCLWCVILRNVITTENGD